MGVMRLVYLMESALLQVISREIASKVLAWIQLIKTVSQNQLGQNFPNPDSSSKHDQIADTISEISHSQKGF